MGFEEKLEKHKKQIFENIELGREKGVNKISAILAIQDERKDDLERELVQILIEDGYKVSSTKGDFKVLTIEW